LNAVLYPNTALLSNAQSIIELQNSSVEPHLDLVSSVAWKGYRCRAVFNRVYYRPISETFHDFLISVVKWTFGKQWWKHQIKVNPNDRHIVVNWSYDLSEFQKLHTIDANKLANGFTYEADAPGPVWALLSLGYDLFCLQAKNQLPQFLAERLRRHREFQSARYEIASAAIMARSGFEIQYLDEVKMPQKHCEFIATHKNTGIQIGVEAKSRVRPGVLHEKGNFNYLEDWKGILDLISRAKQQKPAGIPFFIFVDFNLPPLPSVSIDQKPWIADLKRALSELGHPSPSNPEPFTALILTNFSHHYGSMQEKSFRGESGLVLPDYSENPLPDTNIIQIVIETLNKYDQIPNEV
jgi:hypothetical protein